MQNTKIKPSKEKADIVYYGEAGYLKLLADTMEYGCDTPDRTGVGRRKLFERFLRYDLREEFPSFTARNTPPGHAFEEFWAFLKGIVNIHPYLSEKGVKFWEGNTTREFLDDRGLHDLPVGHFGKSYGFQMRHFDGELDSEFKAVGGIDQLKRIHDTLISNPFDSRLLNSMWNPAQEAEMALPPCWYAHQFLVTLDKAGDKVLNLSVNSRSADLLFGTPYNVQQYAMYLLAMAKSLGMIAGELSCRLVDAHIYGKESDFTSENVNKASQFKYVEELLKRDYSETQVKATISKSISSLEDLLSLEFNDFDFENYNPNTKPFETPRPIMAV